MKALASLWLFIPLLLAQSAEVPTARHAFIVIAHRGNHTRAHENTLTAFRHAIEAGADYVELDVRRTADGQYVLMHDRSVDHMTTGHGLVDKLTFEQIRSLKVRDLKRPKIPEDTVPSFAEALEVCRDRIHIYLDFKEGDRKEVAKIIRDAGMLKQVIIYDGDEGVEGWHQAAPELPVITSLPDGITNGERLVEFAKSKKVEVLDGPWESYSPEQLKAAKNAGVMVWPDIQAAKESEPHFKTVHDRGFAGAQTDHPEELIAWLKSQGLR